MLYDSPKFAGCNAPICPMHTDWRKAVHLPGEPSCLWLRELRKEGGAVRVAGALRADQFETVLDVHQELLASAASATDEGMTHGLGRLSRDLARSARSGSRLDGGAKLQR